MTEDNLAATASSNLTGFYKFESGAITTDSSGNNHDLTEASSGTRSVTASGKHGSALSRCDGPSDRNSSDTAWLSNAPTNNYRSNEGLYINADTLSVQIANTFSIAFWKKFNASELGNGDANNNKSRVESWSQGGCVGISADRGGTNNNPRFVTTCYRSIHYNEVTDDVNDWHHVVLTKRGNTANNVANSYCEVFIDGVSSGKQPLTTTGRNALDRRFQITLEDGDGPIDSVRTYNRVLTQAEITSLATDTPIPTGPEITFSGTSPYEVANGSSVTVQGSLSSAPTSGTVSITYGAGYSTSRFRNLPTSATVTNSNTFEATIQATPVNSKTNSEITVTISATDADGTRTKSFVVRSLGDANVAPVLRTINPQNATVGTAKIITLSATDANAEDITFEYSASDRSSQGFPAIGTFSGTDLDIWTWTPQNADIGSKTIRFTVTSSGQTHYRDVIFTIKAADTTAPNVTVTSTKTHNSITLNITSNETGRYSATLNGVTETGSITAGTPVSETYTGLRASTRYTYSVTATDGSGNTSIARTGNITTSAVPIEAPSLTGTYNFANIYVNTTETFNVTYTDPNATNQNTTVRVSSSVAADIVKVGSGSTNTDNVDSNTGTSLTRSVSIDFKSHGSRRITIEAFNTANSNLASANKVSDTTILIPNPVISNVTINGVARSSGVDIGNVPDKKPIVIAGDLSNGYNAEWYQYGLGRVTTASERGDWDVESDMAFQWTYNPQREHPNQSHSNRRLLLGFEVRNNDSTTTNARFQFNFTLYDNTPPGLTFAWEDGSSANPTAGDTIRGTFTATETDDDDITFTITAPTTDGLSVTDNNDNTVSLVWAIPDTYVGDSITVTVVATDVEGGTTSEQVITVTPAQAAAPVIESAHDNIAKWSKDHTLEFDVMYTDSNTPDEDTTLTVASDQTMDDGIGNQVEAYTVNNTEYNANKTALTRSVEFTPLTTGTHTITISLVNDADSSVFATPVTFEVGVVDVVAGVISYSPESAYTINRFLNIPQVVAEDPNNPDENYTYTISLHSSSDALPSSVNIADLITVSGAIQWTPPQIGNYVFVVTKTNSEFSTISTDSDPVTINVVANRPPTITPATNNPSTITAGSTLTLNYTFSDNEGDPIPEATVNASRGTLTVSTDTVANDEAQLVWAVPNTLPAGDYDVIITCGATTHTSTITVSNALPVITPNKSSGRSIVASQQEVVRFDVTDPESTPFSNLSISHGSFTRGTEYTRTVNGAGTRLTLRYTPLPAHIGTQTFTVSVTSLGVVTTLTYVLEVVANRPPVITPVAGNPSSGTAGQSVTLNYELVDTDGDAIPVPTTDLPTAQTTITPSMSGGGAANDRLRVVWAIPANTPAGSFDITISAGSGTLTTTLTIINTAPTITPNKASGRSITEGRTETITFTVSDPESSPISNLIASHPSFTSGTEYSQFVVNNVLTLGYTPTRQHRGTTQRFTISVDSAGVTTTLNYDVVVIADILPVVSPQDNTYPLRVAQNTRVQDTFLITDANDVVSNFYARSDTIPQSSLAAVGSSVPGGRLLIDWTPTSETITGAHTFTITVITAHSTTDYPFVIIVERAAGQYSREIIVNDLYTTSLINDVDTTDPLTDYTLELTGPNTTDTLAITREGTIHKLRFRPTVVGMYRVTVSVIAGIDVGHSITYDFTVVQRADVLQTVGVYINGVRRQCVSCKIDDSFEKSIPVAELVLPADVNVQHNDDVKIILDPNFTEANLNTDTIGTTVKKLPFSDYGTATQNPDGTINITYDTELEVESDIVDDFDLFLPFENSIQPNSGSTYTLTRQNSNPEYVSGKYGTGFTGSAVSSFQLNYLGYETSEPSTDVTFCYWVRGNHSIRLYDANRKRIGTISTSRISDRLFYTHSSVDRVENYTRADEHFIVCTIDINASSTTVKIYIDGNTTPKTITLGGSTYGLEEIGITNSKQLATDYIDSFRVYHRILSTSDMNDIYTFTEDSARRITNEVAYISQYNGFGLAKQSFSDTLALDMTIESNGPKVNSERDIQILDLSGLAQYKYNIDTRSTVSINETHMIFYEFDFTNKPFAIGLLVNEPSTRKNNVTNGTVSTLIHCRNLSGDTIFKIDIVDTAGVLTFVLNNAGFGGFNFSDTYRSQVQKIIIRRDRGGFIVDYVDVNGDRTTRDISIGINETISGIMTINSDYYDISRMIVYGTSKGFNTFSNELKPVISTGNDDLLRRFNDPKIIIDDGLKCFLPLNGDLRDHTETGNDGITVDHSGVVFDRSEDRFGTAFRGDTTS